MRVLANKKIEFFIKSLFLSEPYLLKKRAERFYKKQTEREICYLPNLINKSLASIDIGVYRGVYSYFLSRESEHVYAFEANPLLIQKLKKGFKKYKNITIENLAVSSSQGIAKLKIPLRNESIDYLDYEELYQLGTATIHQENHLSNTKFHSFEVEKINLDEYDFDHKIGFIKIDVEGHELDIITGAKRLILENKPNLLLEIEERHTGTPNIKVINEIKKLGYNCFSLNNQFKLDFINEDNVGKIMNNNFIFIPI
jgi:FkbM family methyltransferase